MKKKNVQDALDYKKGDMKFGYIEPSHSQDMVDILLKEEREKLGKEIVEALENTKLKHGSNEPAMIVDSINSRIQKDQDIVSRITTPVKPLQD
jgi:hypothetical protein